MCQEQIAAGRTCQRHARCTHIPAAWQGHDTGVRMHPCKVHGRAHVFMHAAWCIRRHARASMRAAWCIRRHARASMRAAWCMRGHACASMHAWLHNAAAAFSATEGGGGNNGSD
eukprot:222551-Chlamydomonas_euryale.AAC.1